MRTRTLLAVKFSLFSLFAVGCASTTVVKNPGCDDDGIRYYRPKPYLMIKPAAAEGKVEISITQLPDYNEEYSIHINAGLGSNASSVSLTDGWNLTGLDVNVDSQTDELINAAANAATAAAGFASRSDGGTTVVHAKDVPMGLYEAVVGRDNCGRKQLYGWRYVGFLPFSQCPTFGVGGPMQHDCNCDIWGLIWKDGVLTFKTITNIQWDASTETVSNGESEDEEVGDDAPAPTIPIVPMPAP